MKRFKIVSLDMFQTLVDVNSRRNETWKLILEENFSVEMADKYWKEANKLIFQYFNNYVRGEKKFLSVKTVFENCYRQLFSQFALEIDPKVAAQILVNQHRVAIPYDETEEFVNMVKEYFKVCIVSDTDREMILPIIDKYKFEKVFLSEDYRAYKNEETGRIFQEVLQYYKVRPEDIIHIGDGYSDIVGASKVGITTCWLNREGKEWCHDIKPDYIITSLLELSHILDFEAHESA